jgi:hypothetical protein
VICSDRGKSGAKMSIGFGSSLGSNTTIFNNIGFGYAENLVSRAVKF